MINRREFIKKSAAIGGGLLLPGIVLSKSSEYLVGPPYHKWFTEIEDFDKSKDYYETIYTKEIEYIGGRKGWCGHKVIIPAVCYQYTCSFGELIEKECIKLLQASKKLEITGETKGYRFKVKKENLNCFLMLEWYSGFIYSINDSMDDIAKMSKIGLCVMCPEAFEVIKD
jgi:hypothetical protein